MTRLTLKGKGDAAQFSVNSLPGLPIRAGEMLPEMMWVFYPVFPNMQRKCCPCSLPSAPLRAGDMLPKLLRVCFTNFPKKGTGNAARVSVLFTQGVPLGQAK